MKPLIEAQLYRDAADTLRYHTQRTLRQQTVGQHTFNMLMLVQLIEPAARKEVLVAVMHHDLPEHFTGDMPAPIKRASPALKVLMDELETDLAPLYKEFDLLPGEWALIKWVDLFELTMFGLEELKMGNRFAEGVVKNGIDWLSDSIPPSAVAAQLLREACITAYQHGVVGITDRLPDFDI